MRISPTLTDMATYPFVQLHEARAALELGGHVVIAFGEGNPNQPTEPLIRQELDFLPDLDAVDEETWRRTAIFWVNYPNNPTGATAPLSFYERLAELAVR